jgi:hypothetical protein
MQQDNKGPKNLIKTNVQTFEKEKKDKAEFIQKWHLHSKCYENEKKLPVNTCQEIPREKSQDL